MTTARTARGLVRLRFGRALQTGAHAWARYLPLHAAFRHSTTLTSGTSENIDWLTCRSGWAGALVRMWLGSASRRANCSTGAPASPVSASRAGRGRATRACAWPSRAFAER